MDLKQRFSATISMKIKHTQPQLITNRWWRSSYLLITALMNFSLVQKMQPKSFAGMGNHPKANWFDLHLKLKQILRQIDWMMLNPIQPEDFSAVRNVWLNVVVQLAHQMLHSIDMINRMVWNSWKKTFSFRTVWRGWRKPINFIMSIRAHMIYWNSITILTLVIYVRRNWSGFAAWNHFNVIHCFLMSSEWAQSFFAQEKRESTWLRVGWHDEWRWREFIHYHVRRE